MRGAAGLLAVACFIVGTSASGSEDQRPAAAAATVTAEAPLMVCGLQGAPMESLRQECVPPSDCCKICGKGKACGNSCIRRDYRCHKGRGCSCNSYEVCR